MLLHLMYMYVSNVLFRDVNRAWVVASTVGATRDGDDVTL